MRVMFPMITTLEEIRKVRAMVRRACQQLKDEKKPCVEIPVGMMLEVPAAAISINDMLPHVDFVSIGSNDLVQYLMAADRDNPKVAHLCEPFSPALLKLLNHIIKACNQRGTPVTLCGEMAGRPRCVLPLFGMGLRHFSMSPAFVPSIKELVRSIDRPTAHTIAKQVLRMRTTSEIKDYLTEQIRKLCPNVAMFDTIQ